tara:strand:+ start:3449 stop:7315 length:3867 start_codon:yes stop_codon:yes gene_type:complete
MNEEEIPGLPDGELLEELRQEDAAEIEMLEARQEQEKQAKTAQPFEPSAPVEQKTEEPKKEEPEGETNTVLDTAGTMFKNWAEANMAPAAGALDFVVDTINLIPNVNLPKARKFETEYGQVSREIASFVVPNIMTSGAASTGAKALHAKVGWNVGNTKLMKVLGNAGIDIGTGAAVDYINSRSREGDNLSGTLKKMFPKTFSFISDDIATLDGDHPDVKRAKSISEGAYMGTLSSLLEAAGAFARAAGQTKKLTKIIAGPDSAQEYIVELNRELYDKTPESVFSAATKAQEDALDEVAQLNLNKTPEGSTQPIPGVHDVFTEAEVSARTADPKGVVGAAVDAARIKNNRGTHYGRLGSIVTEAARKFGLDANNLTKRTVVKEIIKNLKKGGKFSADLPDGKKMSFEEIDQAGTELAEILIDPRMDTNMLKATLDGFKDVSTEVGKRLNQSGYNAVMKTIRTYLDEYVNMNAIKASAYFVTSEAGQISDIAEGARHFDSPDIVRKAQGMILDRLEYLMVEKGLAANYWGTSLNYLNTWKRFSNNPEMLAASGGNPLEKTEEALANVIKRSKNSIDSLRYIAEERPEFLKPLQMAWEFSDGNIDTLYKLQNFIHESLPNVRKAFLDFQPEIPNQIMQGVWSNIYNSVLSATTTPIRAAAGNLGGIIAKPITTFAGAMVRRDMQTLRRASYQYFAIADTFGKAMHHMAFVFGKAARDPESVAYIVRDDIVAKNAETMSLLKASAEAYVKKGEHGPMMLYNIAETLQDLGNHPWLRYGANAMTALDGFTRSVMASAEARGQVFDEVLSKGGPMPTAKMMEDAADKHYYKMFDKNGMIQNSAVENASREIALNLDTGNVKALSSLIDRAPFLRAFVMFPRTSDNVIQMFDKYSPYSIFTKDYNRLAYKSIDDFSRKELKEIAAEYGIPEDEHTITKINQLRNEVLGRKAVGTAAVFGAGFLFTQDKLRGRGHYDKEVQRTRGKDWVPQTFQGPDGRWYDYSGLGPIADWISFTADVFDNADTLDEFSAEQLLRKATFVLGGSLTNRSMFAGIEPMFDMFAAGNPAAWRRWFASFGSSLIPYSGARNQIGKLLSPGVFELNKDLNDSFQNRNRFMDVVDPSNRLSKQFDWLDGRQVGNYGFWTNLWNSTTGMKVADGMSPEREFLIEVEYDARPTFHKSSKGIEYTAAERSELFRIMGESKMLRDEIRRIMSRKPAKEFRRQIHEQRLLKRKSIDQTLWNNLHYEISTAMRAAQKRAEVTSDFQAVIRQRQFQKGQNDVFQRQGRSPIFDLKNR